MWPLIKFFQKVNLSTQSAVLEKAIYNTFCVLQKQLSLVPEGKMFIMSCDNTRRSSHLASMYNDRFIFKINVGSPVGTGSQVSGDTMEHLLVGRTHAHQGHLDHLVPKNVKKIPHSHENHEATF